MIYLSHSLVSLAFFSTLFIYFRVLAGNKALFAAAALAAFAHCVFLVQQQPQGYTYDYKAHLDTITYYGKHFDYALQPFGVGNESHQPPLYYLLAGSIYWASEALGQEEESWLAVASLNYFFFCMFLLYGLAFIRFAIASRFVAWLAAAALLAWPANLMHSFRISNDILLYLAFAGSCYHFMRWYSGENIRQLRHAILWAAVAFATKNSALLLPVIFTLLLLGKYGRGRNPLRWAGQFVAGLKRLPVRPLRIPLIVLALCLSVGLGRNVYNAITTGNTSVFEGKHGTASLFTPAPTLTEFNPVSFFAAPYAYHPDGEDNLFWNLYLRSLSFGEGRWNGRTHAYVINAFMLGLWAYLAVLVTARLLGNQPLGMAGYHGVHVACIVASTALIRMYFDGFPPWADARHIYPVVIFFIVTYASLLEQTPRRSPVFALGVFLLAGYGCASLLHIALQLGYGGNLPIR